ncbi:MAG: hypothetical protein LBP53_07035 [Candidatus Peribacteria bacterium]|nr:hypothetical protein [Candidatus Peribacteria bacterium]
MANQEIIKIADDDANLTNQLLREMIDGKMDLAHQMYYQMLFYQLGQYTANYPFIYNSIIERAKADKAFAQSIGYALPTSEYA